MIFQLNHRQAHCNPALLSINQLRVSISLYPTLSGIHSLPSARWNYLAAGHETAMSLLWDRVHNQQRNRLLATLTGCLRCLSPIARC
jgi:hypothetical protein